VLGNFWGGWLGHPQTRNWEWLKPPLPLGQGSGLVAPSLANGVVQRFPNRPLQVAAPPPFVKGVVQPPQSIHWGWLKGVVRPPPRGWFGHPQMTIWGHPNSHQHIQKNLKKKLLVTIWAIHCLNLVIWAIYHAKLVYVVTPI
jgi:hypothetical protein